MRIENIQILMSDGVFRTGSVEFDEVIRKVEVSGVVKSGAGAGPYLIPGLVDIHTHGALGGDYTESETDKMHEMSGFYASNGVTSFVATTLTAEEEKLEHAMRQISQFERPRDGARCLGVNVEGPFFSHGKRGAHRADLLQKPSMSFFDRLDELSGGNIRIACVAPELDGAMEFVSEASKKCTVSLAHSTADYATAMNAFDNGATLVTHLFNGMNSFLHREPGIVGAAMDANAFVEVICDGFHLHPAVVRATFKMFPTRVCLISDSLNCTGMPDGNYESAGLPIKVEGGKAMLRDGSSIAGSTISLIQGVRNAVSLGIPLADAVVAASTNPAKSIGVDDSYGSIKRGMVSDFVLLDNELNVTDVYINGEKL